uniref:Uncharacterized protein n=1 Tax=Arundo donax TaxID=35708 RepID=A0A0A9GAL4_ARUDO
MFSVRSAYKLGFKLALSCSWLRPLGRVMTGCSGLKSGRQMCPPKLDTLSGEW